jgi:hypothetical protein
MNSVLSCVLKKLNNIKLCTPIDALILNSNDEIDGENPYPHVTYLLE